MLAEESRVANPPEAEAGALIDYALLVKLVDESAELLKKYYDSEDEIFIEKIDSRLKKSKIEKFFILELVLSKYWKKSDICAYLFRYMANKDKDAWPWGLELAEFGLKHPIMDVRSEAINALEVWDHDESREVLRAHLAKEKDETLISALKRYLAFYPVKKDEASVSC